MINNQFFPKNKRCPQHIKAIIDVFIKNENDISSSGDQTKYLKSNDVLKILTNDFLSLGYEVERKDLKTNHSIVIKKTIPVSKGEVNYYLDAFNSNNNTIIEIEAGRATDNHQWMKDLFESLAIPGINYLIIAVKNVYTKTNKSQQDFKTVTNEIEAIYNNNNVHLPLKGILIVGYRGVYRLRDNLEDSTQSMWF